MLSKMLRRATLLSLLHHPSLSLSPCPRTWTTLLFFFGPSSSSPFSSSSSSPFGVGVEKACSMGSGEQEEVPMIKEGQAKIHFLHGNSVFYNKTQIVNRDLSIAVLQAFTSRWQEEQLAEINRKKSRKKIVSSNESEQKALDSPYGTVNAKDLRVAENHSNMGAPETSNIDLKHTDSLSVEAPKLQVLEALSASGLRALRYACEVEGVGSVVALDNDPVAHEACKKNIELNGPVAISKVQANIADARVYMLTHEKQFDVVDLDPYGSPSIFLDSAVQSVADGGLLMCTATDMAVLCGNNGEVCYSKYGSYPLRGKYCHEMALRMLLASIESHANRYKRHIVPLLSLSVDFYIRVFVRIYTSANEIKASPSKLSYVYQCVGCDSYHLQPVGRISNKNNSIRYLPGVGPTVSPGCKQCGKYFNMGGPIWSEPIHDSEWVSCILNGVKLSRDRYPAYDKVHSILTSVSEELLDVPLFLSPHSICATLKCTPPPSDLFRYAIVNAGYRVSGTHANPLGVKTDASMDAIWDIMRCWVKLHPVKAHSDETPATVILSKEPSLQANFSKVSTALSKAKLKGVPRFLPNPEGYWGPKPRAGRQITSKHANLFQSPAIPQKNLSESNHSNGNEHRVECCEQPSKTMNSTHDVEIK